MTAQEKIINLLIKAVPNPIFISGIDLSRKDCVIFTYRDDTFVVNERLAVEEYRDSILRSNTASIFLQELLNRVYNDEN